MAESPTATMVRRLSESAAAEWDAQHRPTRLRRPRRRATSAIAPRRLDGLVLAGR